MPVSYRIFDDPPLVVVTWEGRVTLEESAGNFLHYLSAGHAYSGRPVLADCSGVTDLAVTFEGMLEFVTQKLSVLDPFEATMIKAVYAPDEAIFAQWQEYKRLVSSSDRMIVEIFRTRDAALSYLQVDPHAVERQLTRG